MKVRAAEASFNLRPSCTDARSRVYIGINSPLIKVALMSSLDEAGNSGNTKFATPFF
jgi:hypothetical protein